MPQDKKVKFALPKAVKQEASRKANRDWLAKIHAEINAKKELKATNKRYFKKQDQDARIDRLVKGFWQRSQNDS